jgi:hypothetical protein
VDSFSCSFTSISFLTTSCSFTYSDVNEHERLSNITLKTQIEVKEQILVRKDIDVNEHERLSNITLKTQIEVKENFYCCFFTKTGMKICYLFLATINLFYAQVTSNFKGKIM